MAQTIPAHSAGFIEVTRKRAGSPTEGAREARLNDERPRLEPRPLVE